MTAGLTGFEKVVVKADRKALQWVALMAVHLAAGMVSALVVMTD